jgi:hypothetical protein
MKNSTYIGENIRVEITSILAHVMFNNNKIHPDWCEYWG